MFDSCTHILVFTYLIYCNIYIYMAVCFILVNKEHTRRLVSQVMFNYGISRVYSYFFLANIMLLDVLLRLFYLKLLVHALFSRMSVCIFRLSWLYKYTLRVCVLPSATVFCGAVCCRVRGIIIPKRLFAK